MCLTFLAAVPVAGAASLKSVPTEKMMEARGNFTLTLLPDGTVLAAGGRRGSSGYVASEIFYPAEPTWKKIPSEKTRRDGHTATLLSNGKVLIAGGVFESTRTAHCLLYKHTRKSWSDAAKMNQPRAEHAAVLLKNGKVLVSGGCVLNEDGTDVVALASAELYDPSDDSWTPAGSMNFPRYYHEMVLLSDGRVLVAGGVPRGVSTEAIPICEIYDPETGVWTKTGAMAVHRRTSFTLSPLPGGKAIAVGGAISWTRRDTDQVEIYDSTTGQWSRGDRMPATRSGHTATLLKNGMLLVLGGWEHPQDYGEGKFLQTALLYDASADKWIVRDAPVDVKAQDGAAVLLRDGRVLAAGGDDGVYPVSDSTLITVDPAAKATEGVQPAAKSAVPAPAISVPPAVAPSKTPATGNNLAAAVYPNPFSLSADPEMFVNNIPARSALKIYASGGALVRPLEDSDGDGVISWDGKDISGKPVEPGAYYGILRSGKASANIKITVLK